MVVKENGGNMVKVSKSYDYIIVGAGSAGCVLANRLTIDPNIRVLLIEAGGRDSDPMIKIPLVWMQFVLKKWHDWGYESEPEPHMDDRRIECVRAKVLGGCSSINAMTWVRGSPGDYDRWARPGLEEWSYDGVLPYLKKTETWTGGGDELRGGDGPVKVRHSSYDDPLFDSFFGAAAEAGLGGPGDYNGASQFGVHRSQQNIVQGRRFSAADAFLRPALKRPNLTLRLKSFVTRIVFEGDNAVGIEIGSGNGATEIIRADSEVILSGGAINSPQLLMISGIGSADALKAHGIDPVCDLGDVGQNLQDHISVGVNYHRKSPGPFIMNTRFDRLAVNMAAAYLFGVGPATDFPGGLTGFIKIDPASDVPDIQFLFNGAPMLSHPWFPMAKPPWKDGFGCRAVLLHPESRGHVELRSSDPKELVALHQNFLATDKDREILREGFKRARELVRQSALDEYRGEEAAPGANVVSDDAIDAHIRATGTTVHHPCGTCRMGADEGSVVDGELKVRGVNNLRVIDASVMPDLISGNIHAAVLMIAEKGADLVLG
jgi:4-pyridoxate dehydrogenase